MDTNKYKDLLNRYNSGNCTEEEKAIIESWFLTWEDEGSTPVPAKIEQVSKEVWSALPIYQSQQIKLRLWKRLASAAAVIVIFATALYFYNLNDNKQSENIRLADSILPGTDKAILTLADGTKINLSDVQSGELAKQADISIQKTSDGQVVYTTGNTNNESTSQLYNTINTPKGGQYQLILPDGSKVWLNAASSLKYPVSFGGQSERRVELVGEAYFEVVHNKKQPFRVQTTSQTIEVLGTHFNINNYADELNTITTLAQGSVKVTSGSISRIIKPGEAAETAKLLKNDIKVTKADMETALGWKNGWIEFKNADIQTLLRQVARWYNLEIIYRGEIPKGLFTGHIPRQSKLSAVVAIFKINNVNFTIESSPNGKKLIVTQ